MRTIIYRYIVDGRPVHAAISVNTDDRPTGQSTSHARLSRNAYLKKKKTNKNELIVLPRQFARTALFSSIEVHH